MNMLTLLLSFLNFLTAPRCNICLLCFALLSGTLPATSAAGTPDATLDVIALRTEYKENPLGIDIRKPRLSWQIQSDRRGILQSAYQVQVGRNERDLRAGRNPQWDSGKVNSEESTQHAYTGPTLQSEQRYYWRVRVWDSRGLASAWSNPAYWEMGLLEGSDWRANWIEPDLREDTSKSQSSPLLRGTFKANGKVQQARAYVSSHGLYQMHLNGQRVGDQVFTPGWTSYNKRLQYQTFDITNLLRSGENVVGVMLGDGWYRGNIGFGGQRNFYGERLALLMQIRIKYEDGHQELIGSNQNWKAATGPILMSEIYHGETYDSRLEKSGWISPNYDDRDWSGVKLVNHRKDDLIAPAGPPVGQIEEIRH